MSSSNPLTSNRIDPRTVRSITASGLFAKRHEGSTPMNPLLSTAKVDFAGKLPAEYETTTSVMSPSDVSETISMSLMGASASWRSSASEAEVGSPASSS